MDGTDDVIHAYLAHLRYMNRRPSGISQRGWALRYLVRFVAPRSVFELTEAEILAFCSRDTLGPEGRNNAISHVRGFYRWAMRQGYCATDPTAELERPHRPKRMARPTPTDAVGLALRTAPNPIRQWFYLATYAGLRACECAQLSGADFILGQTPPIVLIQESKGGNPKVAVLGAEVLPIAHELAQARGWCFPKGDGDPSGRTWSGHITANQLQKRANRFLHEQGIPQTFHQLRHWFGTELLRSSGGNSRIAQEGLRHDSANSMAIYTHVANLEIQQALDALPRLTA